MKNESLNRNRSNSIDLEVCEKLSFGAYHYSKFQAERCMQIQQRIAYNLNDKHILLIYTGGTIGMEKTPNGLAPRKNFLYNYLIAHPNFCDKEYTLNALKNDMIEKDCLITPLTVYNRRVYYRVCEFDHTIDSANMNLHYWKKIGKTIQENYNNYDGFVILHGTDTMNYTAAILSFQLENLNKPVILTGSQIPLAEMRNDGIKNLVDSITIAGTFHIPEVCIMFNGNLYRGNRTIKNDNINYDAFESPNLRPLIEIGIYVKVNWDLILPHPSDEFSYYEDINNYISIVKFFPIISDETFEIFFHKPNEAVIIETYGSGNMANDRKRVIEILKDACSKGIIIVNVSQCRKGLVTNAYETGNALSKIGVIFAGDMTVECALAKLSYLLGKYKDKETVKKLFCESIRGEITNNKNEIFSLQSNSFINSLIKVMKLDCGDTDNVMIAKTLLPTVINELVEKNQLDILMKLKNEIKSLNSHDFTKKNPLHIAAINGHKEVTEFLINCHVSINEIDDHSNTPLNYACLKKHKEVAIIILKNGGILNMKGEMGDIFCKLGYEGDLDTIRLFHMSGANLMTSNFDGRTLAHIAAAEGKIDIMNFLVNEIKLNIMVSDRWGNTPYDDANEEIRKIISEKFKLRNRKLKNKNRPVNLLAKKTKRNDICIKHGVE